MLSIKDHFNKIEAYPNNFIDDHKTQGECKIQSKMAIKFISSKDSDETQTIKW